MKGSDKYEEEREEVKIEGMKEKKHRRKEGRRNWERKKRGTGYNISTLLPSFPSPVTPVHVEDERVYYGRECFKHKSTMRTMLLLALYCCSCLAVVFQVISLWLSQVRKDLRANIFATLHLICMSNAILLLSSMRNS